MMRYVILFILPALIMSKEIVLTKEIQIALHDAFDVDGDGKVTKDEIHQILTDADINKDNRINVVEFTVKLGLLNPTFIGIEADLFDTFVPGHKDEVDINEVVASLSF